MLGNTNKLVVCNYKVYFRITLEEQILTHMVVIGTMPKCIAATYIVPVIKRRSGDLLLKQLLMFLFQKIDLVGRWLMEIYKLIGLHVHQYQMNA